MPVTYRKVAFGGQVVSVDRLADGAFEVNFAVPPPGADQQAVERYRQNPDYARYADEVAAGATVQEAPPAVVYTGRSVGQDRVTTTDATPAELFRRALAPLTAYTALVHLVGVDRGNGNVRYLRATLAAKRLGGGAILVNDVGGQPYRLLADHRDGSAGTWAIAPSVAGNDVVITVTGAAGRTIDWFLRIEVDAFTPGGVP